MGIFCCKDCTKHTPGCHAKCEAYINQKKEHDRKMNEIKKAKYQMNMSYSQPWSDKKRRRLCGNH